MNIHIVAALVASGLLHGLTAMAAALPETAPLLSVAAPERGSPLKVMLTVHKIVSDGSREQRFDATSAEPGDILEYRAEYRNIGAMALTQVLATLPLPEHTSFIQGSADPADVAVSTRAAKEVFVPLARARALAAADKTATKSDAAAAYGTLRWAIERLEPGQSAVVSARVSVDRAVAPQRSQSAPAAQAGDIRKRTH